jgi:GT2 family glycosyltransferase
MDIINTFVIPHNNYEGLRQTLESIHRNTPKNFKIILIDQNPIYQEVDDLVDLHIYTNGKNLGFAKCMNMGIRLSDTPWVSCWNDDCECINPQWWEDTMEVFSRYSTALGVNPGSPRNPKAAGEEPINPHFEYKPDFNDEEYSKIKDVMGRHIIDGICTFATVFKRDRLDLVAGTVPGCWYDEYFYPGGGEDYDLNRRAYMTKSPENEFKGYRMLGGGGYVWHWWYSTKKANGETGVKHCGNAWFNKWGIEGEGNPDIYGKTGKQLVPNNVIRKE